MKRTEWLQETRILRFAEAPDGWTEKRLTQEEAARLLRVCAHVPALRGSPRGGRTGRSDRQADAGGVGALGAGGRGSAAGGAVPGEPSGVVGGAASTSFGLVPRQPAIDASWTRYRVGQAPLKRPILAPGGKDLTTQGVSVRLTRKPTWWFHAQE